MKLLFAIKTLNAGVGGAERVFCIVCSELVKRGHDLTILTFDSPGGRSFYPLEGQISRIDLGIGDASKPATIRETIHRIFFLRKIIRRECPSITIAFMHSMFIPIVVALLGTGISVIGCEHSTAAYYRLRPWRYILFMAIAPFLKKITVVSESARALFPGSVKKRMIIVPNPVEIPVRSESVSVYKKRKIILTVGRMESPKDHTTLLNAFAKILPRFPDWELRIIGDGSLRKILENLVCQLGIEKQVFMPGITSNIDKEYRNADVFALSSRYESFGLVIAEAMSYGLPVIGFADCSGINEMIHHNETGLLSSGKPDRVISLARDLEILLSDPDLCQRFGQAGKIMINKYYSIEYIINIWENLLCQKAG
jgi:glycosyltransferase involved in cell wall biosynthesis